MNFYQRLGIFGLVILALVIFGHIRQSGTEKKLSEKPVMNVESSDALEKTEKALEKAEKKALEKTETKLSEQVATGSEAELRDRVNAYWQHKIKGEFAEAYLYEHPNFRKGVNLTNYVKGFVGGMAWQKVDIESVSTEKESATVLLKINYILVGIYTPNEGLTRNIRDYWQWSDDHWYHRFKPSRKDSKQ
ncbi:antitoxin [Desulfonema magnum]|uniref:Uncharacterized protein n=1 Tax=Desulfonema magnum TaxID=45655 RepID=A0A975GL63_9BACT|nr:antitoxin [Desulfonema magnum]QTA84478.1 Uncharacterized protein dnm_004740 [Desulfonema magnum]